MEMCYLFNALHERFNTYRSFSRWDQWQVLKFEKMFGFLTRRKKDPLFFEGGSLL